MIEKTEEITGINEIVRIVADEDGIVERSIRVRLFSDWEYASIDVLDGDTSRGCITVRVDEKGPVISVIGGDHNTVSSFRIVDGKVVAE